MFFISNSYLLLQIERAHKILRVLRGPRWNVTKELTDIKVALGWDFMKKNLTILSDVLSLTRKKAEQFCKTSILER